jgi:hypothetical protein
MSVLSFDIFKFVGLASVQMSFPSQAILVPFPAVAVLSLQDFIPSLPAYWRLLDRELKSLQSSVHFQKIDNDLIFMQEQVRFLFVSWL